MRELSGIATIAGRSGPRSLAWRAGVIGVASALLLGAAACAGEDAAEELPPEDAVEQPEPEPAAEPEPVEAPEEPDEPEGPDELDGPTAAGEATLLWSAEHEQGVEVVAPSPDGEHLAVGAEATFVYQLADGRLMEALVRRHRPEDLAWRSDGEHLAIGLGVHGVSLTEADSGEELAEVGEGYNSRASFAADDAHLATGERGGAITLWSADGDETLAELVADDLPEGPGMEASVTALEHHPDDSALLAATHWQDCTTRIWDTDAEAVLHTLDLGANCHLNPTPFAFAPDGEIMTGPDTEAGEVVLRSWTVEDAEPVDHLPYDGQIADVAYSPDGSLLAVAGREAPRVDAQVHVFDTASGELAALLEPEASPDEDFVQLATVAISPDGGHVVLGRTDGWVEVWQLPGAQELVAPEPEPCEPLPIPSDVLFDTGSAALKGEADAVLTELAEELAEGFPDAELTFVGHTDSRGEAAANQELSEDRGEAVATWFEAWAQDHDVEGWSIAVEGRGDTELAAQDVDEDGEFLDAAGALNRRVEIVIDAEECDP